MKKGKKQAKVLGLVKSAQCGAQEYSLRMGGQVPETCSSRGSRSAFGRVDEVEMITPFDAEAALAQFAAQFTGDIEKLILFIGIAQHFRFSLSEHPRNRLID